MQGTLFDLGDAEGSRKKDQFKRVPPVEEMYTPEELALIQQINARLEAAYDQEMINDRESKDDSGSGAGSHRRHKGR